MVHNLEKILQHGKELVRLTEEEIKEKQGMKEIHIREEFKPSETRKKMWIEMMHEMDMQNKKKGISCSDADYRGSPKDNESVDIGPNHTFHSHSCGRIPSEPDVNTTRGLEKEYLCIGYSPTKETFCYHISDPKGKPAYVFK